MARNNIIMVRLDDDELEVVQKAAKREDRTKSTLTRLAVVASAKRIVSRSKRRPAGKR